MFNIVYSNPMGITLHEMSFKYNKYIHNMKLYIFIHISILYKRGDYFREIHSVFCIFKYVPFIIVYNITFYTIKTKIKKMTIIYVFAFFKLQLQYIFNSRS